MASNTNHIDTHIQVPVESMMEWENDDSRIQVEDLPDNLTPFITRTTWDYVAGGVLMQMVFLPLLVAVKAFRFSKRDGLEVINRKISREIGILKMLRHDNIVLLLGIATGFGHIPELHCLVSPWIPNGTLNTYLASNHNLTHLDRSCMLKDVGAGLCYLTFGTVHLVHVMHGDITGVNPELLRHS
ncbi:hypothetical protein DEU56DRAFT_754290 [Suillus clintonianus]|uniref:uncharacterized protein n=1 Tax=Suillus clintonianus TaxID=1904413 RepID=UPI001B87D6A0|nr:uncharacterized protein DEU56DRAFT_754290 [Suillus clintonianus]KAG2144221.1 hypothetical protein DEU56DRAFT_754290 [Suillus clintonianus]